MTSKICIIPLGQSPRDDFVAPIAEAVGNNAEIMQRGAMDGLTAEEIMALERAPGDYMVGTNLPTGERVGFPKKHVLERMPGILKELEEKDVNLVSVCCTEVWPEYEFDGIWVEVSRLIFHLVKALNIKGKAVVAFPQEDQREMVSERWENNPNLTFKVLPPKYTDEELQEFLNFLVEFKPAYIVLDCFGFDQKLKDRIKGKVDCPVILPITVLANTLKEIS